MTNKESCDFSNLLHSYNSLSQIIDNYGTNIPDNEHGVHQDASYEDYDQNHLNHKVIVKKKVIFLSFI